MRTVFLSLIFSLTAAAQQPVSGDSTLFDFWVGDWDLTWTDPDGSTAKGTNRITKILDGNVIHENFIALTGQSKGFKGESFSLLDRRSGTWKQTWVDNQSSYLPFTGGSDESGKFFAQEFARNGKLIKQKMLFRNISADGFVWDWMNSVDSGKTWNTAWSINYKRKR